MAITKRGENIYLVRVYIGRHPFTRKRIEINRTVYGTRADAKKVETELKTEKEWGRLRTSPRMRLNKLLDLYSESRRHIQAKTTQVKDKTYFDYYIRPFIGDMPLNKINRGVIQELFNTLLDEKREGTLARKSESKGCGRGLCANTVKNIKKVLNSAFNYAISEGLMTDNPGHHTKLPLVTRSSANSLTIDEAKAFVSVKNEFWYRDAFIFQLHTGLRPEEVMALIWDDIDFEQGTVRIERACKWAPGVFTGFGPPKTKRGERIIGLDPEHLELLKIHFEQQQQLIEECKTKDRAYGEPKIKDWALEERQPQAHLYDSAILIFAKPNGSVPNRVMPYLEYKKMLLRAGIKSGRTNYRWHDLRHTHASFLLSFGLPDIEVAERLGITVHELYNTYSHFLKSRRSIAASLFREHIPVLSK
jgi:integrase